MDTRDVITALRPVLDGALIATDFDGTLAPLTLDPQDSRPVPGVVAALHALAGRGAAVSVITGRDVRTVLRIGGLEGVLGLRVAGMYGIEMWHDGTLDTPEEPASVTALRARLPALLAAGDPALWIEDKRLSLVLHARRCADPPAALAVVRAPVTELAAELGLELHPGADVLEFRIPGHDKGATLRELAAGATAVLYAGDDVGDIPAFEQIGELRRAGVPAYSVGVLSSGVAEIEPLCDVTVPDPDAMAALFAELAAG